MRLFLGLFQRTETWSMRPMRSPKAMRFPTPLFRPQPDVRLERGRPLEQKNIQKLPSPEHGDPAQKTKLPALFNRNK